MKIISSGLASHLSGEVTTLATCWKLTRRDSTVMSFTNHNKDIMYNSLLYKASTGFTPTAIAANSNLSVDNLDIEGMLDDSAIKDEDINAGLYDFAEIEIFMVNYTDLTQGVLNLRRGYLGEVRLSGSNFVAEVRGLMQNLAQEIGELYSPSCRAKLGDSRCKINMEGYTVTGTITSITDNRVFEDSGRSEANNYFDYGKITFTSGNNSGLSMEVKTFIDNEINLVFPMPYNIQIGDGYTMQAGCDKTLSTCIGRYNNVVNFRGEPHVPGIDKMLQTAGTI